MACTPFSLATTVTSPPDKVRTGPLHLTDELADDPMERVDRPFVDMGELGAGATGSVRRVFDPRLLRHTALKHVRPETVHPEVVDAFVGENRILGQLEHSNVVPVHEVGPDTSGGLYASLKLVSGTTLADRLHELGEARLEADNLADLIRIVRRTCDALAYAHDLGVIHCDLKPENILVGEYGEVYVADWGMAHVLEGSRVATSSGEHSSSRVLGGTPAFLSPEQAHGDPAGVGTHTDVFGAGALLYTILSGEPPYGSVPMAEAVYRAVTCSHPPLQDNRIPRRLAGICNQAMALDPADRHADIQAFSDELERFLRGTWTMPTRHFASGDMVVREGESGSCAYVVQSGELEVFTDSSDHRLHLRTLKPGDVFGEMAILSDGGRSASIRAVTDVTLLEVSREALEDGLGLNQWLGTFVTTLASRFREADAAVRAERISQLPEATRADDS